jgi:hypothetical protein
VLGAGAPLHTAFAEAQAAVQTAHLPRQAFRVSVPNVPFEGGADELVARDKCSLDLFWLRDESLLDAETLPAPDEIADEIADDLRRALEQIEGILGDLEAGASASPSLSP